MLHLATANALRTLGVASILQLATAVWLTCAAAEGAAIVKTPTTEPSAEVSSVKQELAIAQVQLADAREFQSKVLDAVYWSLGTVAAVAVLLTGFGWFANFRVYERDRETLERSLKVAFSQEVGDFRDTVSAQLDQRMQSQESLTRSILAELESRMQASIQERVDSSQKALLSEVAALVQSRRDLRGRLLEIQLRLERKDREEWLRKQVLSNALLSSMAMLKISVSLGEEFFVAESLDRIREDIEALAAKNPRLVDSYQRGELVAALERVKGINAQAASVLVQRVAAVFG